MIISFNSPAFGGPVTLPTPLATSGIRTSQIQIQIILIHLSASFSTAHCALNLAGIMRNTNVHSSSSSLFTKLNNKKKTLERR